MAVEIIWSRQAKEDFEAILLYLRDNWSDDIADRFKETAYKKIELLESMPEMGIASTSYPTVRRNSSRIITPFITNMPRTVALFSC